MNTTGMAFGRIGIGLLFLIFFGQSIGAAEWSPELQKIIEAANKEGKLKLTAGSSSVGGSKGMNAMAAAMNKKFGTNIDISFTPGPSQPAVASQVATEYAAGQSSVTDVYLGAAAYAGKLAERGILHPVAWTQLLPGRITPEMIETDSTTIRVYSGLSGATYNTRLAPSVPKTLADFLKPEWKGKIASTPYAASFDALAAKEVWGREKTIDYVKKLSQQITGLLRCSETERVANGEFLALVMDCNGADARRASEQGAPVDHMIPTDAAQKRYYYLAVPKNSEHPNAAKLFTVFAMTPEAQALWWQYAKQDLHLFPESHLRQIVDSYEKNGVQFFETTIAWWQGHPEIATATNEMVKILRTAKN